MHTRDLPVALTIAGSDSGGGAGIQADIKTFQAFGVFGTSALTAITAQDTVRVHRVHPLDPELVAEQIRVVMKDLSPTAVKTGMLATAPVTASVADTLGDWPSVPYVLDPVLVASSGDRLMDDDAVAVVRSQLVPRAVLVTPNLHEARILTGLPVQGEAGQLEAAKALVRLGAKAALVKGGHGEGNEVADVFWNGDRERIWRRPRIHTRSTHGTGCTLSAAVTAELARGTQLIEAVSHALSYVWRAIYEAPSLGRGLGPLNHFVPSRPGPGEDPVHQG
jgi:hydroxymethylpyrimidine/phosphomethylpyrimidine kinase